MLRALLMLLFFLRITSGLRGWTGRLGKSWGLGLRGGAGLEPNSAEAKSCRKLCDFFTAAAAQPVSRHGYSFLPWRAGP